MNTAYVNVPLCCERRLGSFCDGYPFRGSLDVTNMGHWRLGLRGRVELWAAVDCCVHEKVGLIGQLLSNTTVCVAGEALSEQ